MVDSPKYGHWNRSARRPVHLGIEAAPPVAHRRPEDLFRERPAADVRDAQRADSRSERRLSLQRAHGPAPVADAGDSAAAPRRYTGLDAPPRSVAPRHPTSCTIFYQREDLVRGV